MADFYSDFTYSKVVTATTTSSTAVVVDDASLFPTNTILAKSDYWLVFESALTYPNTFEIVKLTNVNTGTETLTVVRAQGSTVGAVHPIGTYVKGALTSDMLRRARSGFTGTSVPSADSDLYVVGDTFYKTDTGVQYIYTGSGFVIPPPGQRASSTATTVSIANNATDVTTAMPLSKSYRVSSIATSRAARVELYATATQMTADASRPIGIDPDSAAGVMLDYVTSAASTVYTLSPLVDGSNLESSPSNNISMRVTNLSGSTGTVAVTLVYVATE